jgi:rhodanese-related sulfurtransferase
MFRSLFHRVDAIDAADAQRRLDTGDILLVDVRGKAEWRCVRAPGGRHIPPAALTHNLDALAKPGKPVAFISVPVAARDQPAQPPPRWASTR